MKIKWIGHSCFVITSEKGVKILTDPFKREGSLSLSYALPTDSVDIVTVSHEHFDHNDLGNVKGKPEILKGECNRTIKDVTVKTVSGTWHDDVKGRERGPNTIFCFDVDGVKVCHLGDLGHELSKDELAALGKVDVLLIPIGGVFTIDIHGAAQVLGAVRPRVAIPMHFKTEHCQWLNWTSGDFIKGKKNARKSDSNEVEFAHGKLPAEGEILVLKYPGQA